MPVITSAFRPPLFLRNGHVQTILAAVLPRKLTAVYQRERLELEDGDFLDLDWLRSGQQRLAVISHGLEGNSSNPSVRAMAQALQRAGWDVLAWNFRSCGGEANRLVRFYHSGETADLGLVIQYAAAAYRDIALVGFSLGGNMTLKYLGESCPHPAIRCAATVSVPVDLTSSSRALDTRWTNRIYLRRFLVSLTAKVEAKAQRFPDHFDTRGLRQMRGFSDFDDRFTSRIHGFRDAADYWERCSARQFLSGITVPTLLLNALDDPFLDKDSFPYEEAGKNDLLFLETPRYGGHDGFVESFRDDGIWAERRVPEFLAVQL